MTVQVAASIITLICVPAVLAFTVQCFYNNRSIDPYGKGMGQLSATLSTEKVIAASVDIYISLYGPDMLLCRN